MWRREALPRGPRAEGIWLAVECAVGVTSGRGRSALSATIRYIRLGTFCSSSVLITVGQEIS